jgi:PAS domain S-box-containing protein
LYLLCRSSTVCFVEMRVGEVARRTGVGVSTLRAWERRYGILEPVRSPSGQRLYTEADVNRVAALCRLVAEGLTLSAAVGRVASAGTAALPTGEGEALLLHQIVQAADQGIWVSQDGRTRYVNPRMAELMACSIDDLLARPALEFVDPESFDAVMEPKRLLRDGHRQRLEVLLRRADGSSFLAEASVSPLHDAAGTYKGEVAVVRDVTLRDQADSEARFRTALLDAIGQAVLAARPDGTIVYANPAAERLLGWRAAELIGRNGLEMLAPPGGATSATRIHSKLLAKRRHTGEVSLNRRDGTHFSVHITGAPVFDGDGEVVGVIAVMSDNSERNQLEQEARTQEQQAEMVALLGARALRDIPDDLNLVLTEAVEATRRLLQTEHAALLEVVPGGDLAIRVSSPRLDEPTIIPFGSRSFAGYAALARKVVLVEDARRDRRFDIEAMPGKLGIVSAIAAPVFGPSGICGVLTADSTTPHSFNMSAVHFMQSIANVVGIALRHR